LSMHPRHFAKSWTGFLILNAGGFKGFYKLGG
ncbi:MAG: hypothetical protein ACI9CE_001682, partial [Flavobacterium sp.]